MRLLFVIIFMFIPSLCFGGQGMGPGPGMNVYSASTTTYFGESETNDANLTWSGGGGGYTLWSNKDQITYTCPGTGSKTLVSLQCRAKSGGGTPGTMKIALYANASPPATLIVQGSSSVSVSSTTAAWLGHITFIGTTTLTGGTAYVIAVSFSNDDVYTPVVTGSGNTWDYVLGDYTSTTFPASLGIGGTNQAVICRAGVQ